MKRDDLIHYSGKIYDDHEISNLMDACKEFWLTEGKYTKQFEKGLADYLGAYKCIVTNSGSSANLLAVSALSSHKLGDRRLIPGDEIITVAAGFPTTVAPIVQNSYIPVFVDVELDTYNIDCSKIEDAISNRTKAIIIAHTMGNPFNLEKVKEICNKYNLWLIEDNCDALGSKYNDKFTGTFGDLGTCSFFPAHHITTGEGGAVIVNNKELYSIVKSFKNWGRDCICEPGKDNTCGKRFSKQMGTLPYGYDHKYIYSHLGYNLKMTDMQAAIGCAQLEKLKKFNEIRRRNYKLLYEGLKPLEDKLILPKPQDNSDPSWFAFVITVRDGINRNELAKYLEDSNIQTRFLFAGNITRHPALDNVKYRISGDLVNSDRVMNDTFLIGVYPGITEDMVCYMIEKIKEYFYE